MNTRTKNDVVERAEPSPVHFSLRSSLHDASAIMDQLHQVAEGVGFCDVGPPINLIGVECAIRRNDPLAGLKAHARGLIVSGQEVVSFMPLSISGFTCVLPNGNKFHIGLCEYPVTVPLADGTQYHTRLKGLAQWISYVRTVNLDPYYQNDRIESHLKAVALLRESEHIEGLSVFIRDPYKQWGDIMKINFNPRIKDGHDLGQCVH